MDSSQLLKGVLDLAVLSVVSRDDAYGYDIVRRLREAGFERVGEASVYGTLKRLYDAGHLSSYVRPSASGPHRKYYSLTAAGRQTLELGSKDWRRFAEVMEYLLEQEEGR